MTVRNKILLGISAFVAIVMTWHTATSSEFAQHPLPVRILTGLITASICLGVGFLTIPLQLLISGFGKHKGFLGEHEIELRDDALIERTDVNESTHSWKGIHKIVSSRNHLYIYIGEGNAHIIPIRSFPTPEDFKNFRNELFRHLPT